MLRRSAPPTAPNMEAVNLAVALDEATRETRKRLEGTMANVAIQNGTGELLALNSYEHAMNLQNQAMLSKYAKMLPRGSTEVTGDRPAGRSDQQLNSVQAAFEFSFATQAQTFTALRANTVWLTTSYGGPHYTNKCKVNPRKDFETGNLAAAVLPYVVLGSSPTLEKPKVTRVLLSSLVHKGVHASYDNPELMYVDMATKDWEQTSQRLTNLLLTPITPNDIVDEKTAPERAVLRLHYRNPYVVHLWNPAYNYTYLNCNESRKTRLTCTAPEPWPLESCSNDTLVKFGVVNRLGLLAASMGLHEEQAELMDWYTKTSPAMPR